RHLKALSQSLATHTGVRVMKVYPEPAVPAGAAAGAQPAVMAEHADTSRIHGALIAQPASPSPAAVADQGLRDDVLVYAGLSQPATGLGKWGEEEAVGGNFLHLAGVLQAYWDREPAPAEVASVQKQVEKAEAGAGPSTSGRI